MSVNLYVRCSVSLGLFESEFYVRLIESSAYVDRSNVRVKAVPESGREVEGEVLAYLIQENENTNQALVELPGEPVVGGLRSWVPKSLLTAA